MTFLTRSSTGVGCLQHWPFKLAVLIRSSKKRGVTKTDPAGQSIPKHLITNKKKLDGGGTLSFYGKVYSDCLTTKRCSSRLLHVHFCTRLFQVAGGRIQEKNSGQTGSQKIPTISAFFPLHMQHHNRNCNIL